MGIREADDARFVAEALDPNAREKLFTRLERRRIQLFWVVIAFVLASLVAQVLAIGRREASEVSFTMPAIAIFASVAWARIDALIKVLRLLERKNVGDAAGQRAI